MTELPASVIRDVVDWINEAIMIEMNQHYRFILLYSCFYWDGCVSLPTT